MRPWGRAWLARPIKGLPSARGGAGHAAWVQGARLQVEIDDTGRVAIAKNRRTGSLMRDAARAARSTASDFITEPVGTRQLERSVYAYAEQAADFSPLAAMIAIAHDEIGTPNQEAAFKPDGGRFRPAWALRPIAGALTPCTLSTLSFPWMEGSVWAYQGPCLLPMLTAPGARRMVLEPGQAGAGLVRPVDGPSPGPVVCLWGRRCQHPPAVDASGHHPIRLATGLPGDGCPEPVDVQLGRLAAGALAHPTQPADRCRSARQQHRRRCGALARWQRYSVDGRFSARLDLAEAGLVQHAVCAGRGLHLHALRRSAASARRHVGTSRAGDEPGGAGGLMGNVLAGCGSASLPRVCWAGARAATAA